MRKIAFGIAAAAAIASTPVLAGTATGTVQVSLNVSSSCSVIAQPLDFGGTNSFAANIDSSSATTIKCTPNANYSVVINNGLNAVGSQRKLLSTSSSATVNYDLYADPARSVVWNPTAPVTGSGTG